LWCLGNVWVVPIVKSIGLGLGLCIWGTTNMVVGWACGCFGILGVPETPPHNTPENYLGVGVCVLALVVFLFIKPTLTKLGETDERTGAKAFADDDTFGGIYGGANSRLLGSGESLNSESGKPAPQAATAVGDEDEERSFVDNWSPYMKTVLGIAMSVMSGMFYGVNFNPPQYVKNNPGVRAFVWFARSCQSIFSCSVHL
jgi:hypothetical protein